MTFFKLKNFTYPQKILDYFLLRMLYNIRVSKQKIILFVFLLIILIGGVLFYFFIQKESKIENYEERDLVDFKTREEILKELEAFKKPSREVEIPNNTNTVDLTIKTEEEIKVEVDNYVKDTKTQTKSDEEILRLLSQ